jgi:hypothetical protein
MVSVDRAVPNDVDGFPTVMHAPVALVDAAIQKGILRLYTEAWADE